MNRGFRLGVLAVLLTGGSLLADARLADYRRLQAWRFSAPLAVPAGGLTLSRDVATLTLASGQLRLMEPTSDGAVTGAVFEGRGRLKLLIPDPVEVEQLHRFADAARDVVDEEITAAVIRVATAFPAGWPTAPAGATYAPNGLAKERTERLLRKAFFDADARVMLALGTPGDDYLLVDVKTRSYGWLLLEWSPSAPEELQLVKLPDGEYNPELWVSLDRQSERSAEGRPASVRRDPIDLLHVDLAIDLEQKAFGERVTVTGLSTLKGTFSAALKFRVVEPGATALSLSLANRAKVLEVTEGGKPLEHLRDHLGKRFAGVDGDVYDSSLVVLLDRPLAQDEERDLTVRYELELPNFVSGRDWYPGPADGFHDPHTATLSFSLPGKLRVRSVGEPGPESEEFGRRRQVWRVTRPARMLGFTVGKKFLEREVSLPGQPRVVAFGEDLALLGDLVKSVASDVAKSQAYFTSLLHVPLPLETLHATSIAAGHGQAFGGLLHLAVGTFESETPGATQLFRAHEVAHEWFGHLVGWKSYRDQWLSEALAEYAAMMYVESAFPDRDFSRQVLEAYMGTVSGTLKISRSRFSRPGTLLGDSRDLRKVGPIDVGFRASKEGVPGYYVQTYLKGSVVVHMLRQLLRERSGSDDLFLRVLHEYLVELKGKEAGTGDFRRILERVAGGDFGWFFRQWIEGNAIPAYRSTHKVLKEPDGRTILELTVSQEGVPEGFRMPLPVRLALPSGRTKDVVLDVAKPSETFRIEVAEPPRKVVLDPDLAVLSRR